MSGKGTDVRMKVYQDDFANQANAMRLHGIDEAMIQSTLPNLTIQNNTTQQCQNIWEFDNMFRLGLGDIQNKSTEKFN